MDIPRQLRQRIPFMQQPVRPKDTDMQEEALPFVSQPSTKGRGVSSALKEITGAFLPRCSPKL